VLGMAKNIKSEEPDVEPRVKITNQVTGEKKNIPKSDLVHYGTDWKLPGGKPIHAPEVVDEPEDVPKGDAKESSK